MTNKPKTKPLVLCIFDGFGHGEAGPYNAITQAKTPHYDTLWQTCPHTLLDASGMAVGLPHHQMGNSEVGHMNIGAGRPVYQDLSRISQAITNDELKNNPVLKNALSTLAESQKALHLFGLLSPGGVHSHEEHLFALLKLAKACGVKQCYVHAMLDGRDTAPQSAQASLEKLEALCQTLGMASIKTLIGRYFAMDRDNHWDRIEQAYRAIIESQAPYQARNAIDALKQAYERGETDEFVTACLIGEPAAVQNGDVMLGFNFRSDRARQLCHAFNDETFSHFKRQALHLSHFVTLTDYDATLAAEVAFPKPALEHLLTDVLSEHGLTQLRLAETEKYAHVTFFFNGGREKPVAGEERLLIHSPNVATYDLKPEMSANEVTDALVNDIKAQAHDVIICNYANADMVGHTGKLDATIKAIECLDHCLGRIIQALDTVHGELLLTADHGNADAMYDSKKHAPITSHTSNLVPFIYRGRHATMSPRTGCLADIAPSVLHLLGIKPPSAMTGMNLIQLSDEND